jgi:hypothetical protein
MVKRSYEYKVSQRVTLTPGTKFRAKGGPYWKSDDGQKISMRARGPFIFYCHETKGKQEWIVAYDKDNGFAVLPLTKRKKKLSEGWVNRPYVVTGRILKGIKKAKKS